MKRLLAFACNLTFVLSLFTLPSLVEAGVRKKRKSLRCGIRVRRVHRLCKKYARLGFPRERFILVSQYPRRLTLCQGKRLMLRVLSGYGRRGFDKFREGDKKTPIGTYRISWMAARHEPRRSSRQERKLKRYQIRHRAAWCKPNPKTLVSEFNRKNGPRGERLWRRPYGGKKAVVMALNYPNAFDRKRGRTGSCIEIHASFRNRWSAGCVTMYPKHARWVYNCVKPGTRVEIRKKL